MHAENIGNRREVCWDEYLWDKSENITVKMHHPEYRGVVLKCDQLWEGSNCCYFQIIRDGNVYRLYYRGWDKRMSWDGQPIGNNYLYWCCAESRDGKKFQRLPLGIVDIPGHPENNVFFPESLDNLHVYKDTNPACPEDEKYKALIGVTESEKQELRYWKSRDGIHFTFERVLVDDGAYDSMNVTFWDPHRECYYLYYRGVHGENTKDGKWTSAIGFHHNVGMIRDVRVKTSKDFIHWSDAERILFDEKQEDYELYTNQIQPYYRADHIYLGNPTRYCDRWKDEVNFQYLPDKEARSHIIKLVGREGTAMTDNILMTSRDGLHFRRTDEAFMTPEMEDGHNWYYGDCYNALGMIETENDRPGMPNEISIYVGRNYKSKEIEFCRYAVRLDGFFSWNGNFAGGYVLTKPFVFEGDELKVNFATSALGYLKIWLCDENGVPIEGYESGKLFGNSVSRPVDFISDLAAISGKQVRMKVELKDADMYSFRFDKKLSLREQ